jgi:hypothetical protein
MIINKSQVFNCLNPGDIIYDSNFLYIGITQNKKKLLKDNISYGSVLINDKNNEFKWITGFVTHCFRRGFVVSNLKYV